MKSCIYVGQVRHRRFLPKQREFRYTLFMMYLDLSELTTVFKKRWLWSARRFSLAWFRRKDHFGDPSISLDTAVRDFVEQHNGNRPKGPIRMLSHLRYFGYCFNPVSFYYCYDEKDTRLDTIVAEVSNTPWGERHCYVLDESIDHGQGINKRYGLQKEFHVSPFMNIDQTYDWRFSPPGKQLAVHMQNYSNDSNKKLFDATLSLEKREITGLNMARTLTIFPFMTGKVIFGIYYQALKMWLNRFPFYNHPNVDQTNSTNMEAPDSAKY